MQYFVKFSIPYQLPWDISLFCISKSVSCTQVCFINKISDGIVYIIHYLKLCILTHMVTMNTFLRSPLRPLARLIPIYVWLQACHDNSAKHLRPIMYHKYGILHYMYHESSIKYCKCHASAKNNFAVGDHRKQTTSYMTCIVESRNSVNLIKTWLLNIST